MFQDGDSVTLRTELLVMPMNAAFASDRERRNFSVTVTVQPFLDDVSQARCSRRNSSGNVPRGRPSRSSCATAWSSTTTTSMGCAFDSAATRRNAASPRTARRWLNVPRFHRSKDFAVRLRTSHPELTDGPCQPCVALTKKVAAVLTAYP